MIEFKHWLKNNHSWNDLFDESEQNQRSYDDTDTADNTALPRREVLLGCLDTIRSSQFQIADFTARDFKDWRWLIDRDDEFRQNESNDDDEDEESESDEDEEEEDSDMDDENDDMDETFGRNAPITKSKLAIEKLGGNTNVLSDDVLKNLQNKIQQFTSVKRRLEPLKRAKPAKRVEKRETKVKKVFHT